MSAGQLLDGSCRHHRRCGRRGKGDSVPFAREDAKLGLLLMTIGAARKEIVEGLLVRVLSGWDMGEIELHAVFPAEYAAKPAARAFVDFFIEEFARDPRGFAQCAAGVTHPII